MISILILTFNEEQNIAHCIESVKWSDDILVVDSFSVDQTVSLARASGARVLQNPFINFAEQRNFGLQHGKLKHDWVLHLDADELVSESLREEMFRQVATSDKKAFRIPSKLIFQGRWLKYSGLYPSYQVRLGRRDVLDFIQVGHGQRERLAPEEIGTLTNGLLHHSFSKGLHDWVEKHNRYSTAEAEHFVHREATRRVDWRGVFSLRNAMRRRRAFKQLSFRLPSRPMLRFFYMYFFRRGFLDGRSGYTYCRLLALYEQLIVLKIRELRRKKR